MIMFLTVVQVICGILLIAIIIMQSGKSAGLSGAIAGVADSFMSKHEAKTADAKMAKATKWIGAVFIILTLAINLLA
ncbi:MAG TPA: preprotein translocase subunit SecG [Firmicutes bacterium]|nr:preprotein translocase subunit SecG [Bacillota bacterium]